MSDSAKDDNIAKDSEVTDHSVYDQDHPNGKLRGPFSSCCCCFCYRILHFRNSDFSFLEKMESGSILLELNTM